jgi:polyferredoxin
MFAFGAVMLVFVGLGLLILGEDTNVSIYAFSFSPLLHWSLMALLGWGILRAMDWKLVPKPRSALRSWADTIYRQTKISVFRWVNFIGFATIVFFPIFRCYFKIPYLFCHVCPRQCVFGFLRPYLIPAALIMNLERQYWCVHACPIGTLHDCQARMGWQARRLRLGGLVAVAVLGFTGWAYFKIMWDLESSSAVIHDWYTFFLKNQYSVSLVVIVIAAVLIAMAHRVRRAFCQILCPVGTCSDLIRKLERTLEKRGVIYG